MKQVRSFPAERHSVAEARHFAAGVIDGAPSDVVEAVVLMVSELATNCIRHVNSAFSMVVERTAGEIRVEVSDRSGGVPTLQSPGVGDLGGRGLRIVEMLSDCWGVEHDPVGGKTVWFTIAVGTDGGVKVHQVEQDQGLVMPTLGVDPAQPESRDPRARLSRA